MGSDVMTKTEYYYTRIKECEDQYINNILLDPNDIYNTNSFNGLINYIYANIFKPNKRTKEYKVNSYNLMNNSILDYSDIDTLYGLLDIYLTLCGKYKITPVTLQFCSMLGISKETIGDWQSGEKRKASPEHMRFAKKLHSACESITLSRAINDNSVGAIFLSKAVYGYRENDTLTIQAADHEPPGLSEKELLAIVNERAELDTLPD